MNAVRIPRKYDVSGLTEAHSQPGSHGGVLRNLQGITSKREMNQAEARAQLHALEYLFGEYGPRHRFTADNIRHIHRTWLSSIYEWAGNYRQVNISKGDFPFAAANQVPHLMDAFGRDILGRNTPCYKMTTPELVGALAVVHCELLLIHPFRDGNGRTARSLAVLMAAQAGLPPLDFSGVKGKKRQEYFQAVRTGLERDYAPMERFFTSVIRRTCQNAAEVEQPCSDKFPEPNQQVAGARPRWPSKRPRK